MFCTTAFSQTTTDSSQTRIVLRCGGNLNYSQPLIIIDGVPAEGELLKKINPNDIDSIWILKETAASALYGYRAMNGVIVITTKAVGKNFFTIKDMFENKPLAGATVKFVASDKKDSLMVFSDSTGNIKTNKLKKGKEYEVNVSYAGYIPYSKTIKVTGGRRETIFLNPDVRNGENVFVEGHVKQISCMLRCWCSGLKIIGSYIPEIEKSLSIKELKIYPNPQQRGKSVIIEFTANNTNNILLDVLSSDRKNVYHNNIKAEKTNRFTIPVSNYWTAGMYVVIISDEKGKIINQQKLIIQ